MPWRHVQNRIIADEGLPYCHGQAMEQDPVPDRTGDETLAEAMGEYYAGEREPVTPHQVLSELGALRKPSTTDGYGPSTLDYEQNASGELESKDDPRF